MLIESLYYTSYKVQTSIHMQNFYFSQNDRKTAFIPNSIKITMLHTILINLDFLKYVKNSLIEILFNSQCLLKITKK